jgi:hypothetical protein
LRTCSGELRCTLLPSCLKLVDQEICARSESVDVGVWDWLCALCV